MRPIAIGCDEAAFDMKETIKAYVKNLGYEVEDYGVYEKTPTLYPDMAVTVAKAVADGKKEGGRFPKLRKSWNMTGNSGTHPPDPKNTEGEHDYAKNY